MLMDRLLASGATHTAAGMPETLPQGSASEAAPRTLRREEFDTPGQLIRGLLKARGWTQRTLATILQVDGSKVHRLVHGKQPIDAKLALILEEILEYPAEQILALQTAQDLTQARKSMTIEPAFFQRAIGQERRRASPPPTFRFRFA